MKKEMSYVEKSARTLRMTILVAIVITSAMCIFFIVMIGMAINEPQSIEKFIAEPSMLFGGSFKEYIIMISLYTIELLFWIAIMIITLSIAQNTILFKTPYTDKNSHSVQLIYNLAIASTVIWYIGILFVLPAFGGVIGLHNLRLSKIAVLLVFYFASCIFNKGNELQTENDEIL